MNSYYGMTGREAYETDYAKLKYLKKRKQKGLMNFIYLQKLNLYSAATVIRCNVCNKYFVSC